MGERQPRQPASQQGVIMSVDEGKREISGANFGVLRVSRGDARCACELNIVHRMEIILAKVIFTKFREIMRFFCLFLNTNCV